jgi:hypothetical protein
MKGETPVEGDLRRSLSPERADHGLRLIDNLAGHRLRCISEQEAQQ